MYDEDIEMLTREMTSFYKEFLPIDSSYELLLETYIRSFLNFWQEARYLKQHIASETAPTLYTIPYAKISIDSALYSKREALNIQGNKTLEEKLTQLDRLGYYTTLSFSAPGDRHSIVCDATFRLQFEGDETLSLYDDYFIRNNRLYILPDFIINQDYRTKLLHATSIKVDNRMIEKKWGSVFGVETGPLLPRGQFQDVVSAFRRLMSSDLTIHDMKEAILLATNWETFNVRDKLTPDLPPHLKRLYDEWYISPAKFIVTLPEELIADKMRLNILLALLDEAKEEQVDYLVSFSIYRKDYFDKYDDESRLTLMYGRDDILYPDHETKISKSMKFEESLFPRYRYDVGRRYEYKLSYDKGNLDDLENVLDGGDHVAFDYPLTLLDTPWAHQIEYVRVRHVEFPEIPRKFSGEQINDNEVKFTVRSASDGTKGFELWGSDVENGRYEKLDAFKNDVTFDESTLIHNATISGMRYYKVRAIAGKEESLLTIPIDINAL